VDDPAFGVPFLSSSEVFRLDPQGEYLISRKNTPHLETLIVTKRDLLIPRSGQIGGIIGRAVMPLPTYYDHAASEHLVRIRCRSYDDACYLWAILASEPGYWAAVGTAFGSSIPSLDTELLSSLSVPFVKGKQRTSIIELVNDSVTKQSEAIHAERQAVEIVEKAIEEAA
jgi:type I restriction enzyme S subunit